MSDRTLIEWTDATWNPVTGCSIVSPGCRRCYAMRLAGGRQRHHPSRAGLTRDSIAGPVWTGEVRFNEQWLDQPLRWRRPRRIFVCAHGDLFHESVPDDWINAVWSVMSRSPRHTFQVLTKRPARMREYLRHVRGTGIPLPNVWLGVSIEDQERADERVPLLLDTPAAVRFVSAEPLLGRLDLQWMIMEPWPSFVPVDGLYPGTLNVLAGHWWPLEGGDWQREYEGRIEELPKLDWVIVGGESGPGARHMKPEWARDLRDQCLNNGVPFFFKQWGGSRKNSQHGRLLDGVQWNQFPSLHRAAECPSHVPCASNQQQETNHVC